MTDNNTTTPEQTNTPQQPVYQNAVVPPEQPAFNPLLTRIVMPGQTFRLPSGGLFYTNGELSHDVVDGEVHVHPMTAIDEIMIKTPDLLFSGNAIKEVFSRCIPQILKPAELLAKDVDYLLICLRKITYGDILELEATHTCKNAKSHGYQISIDDFIIKTKEIDPSKMSNYTLRLENDQTVQLRPVKFMDYVKIMQTTSALQNDKAKDDVNYIVEQAKNIMFESLLGIIISVDDITNRDQILEWLGSIQAGWIKQISNKVEHMAEWGPIFTSETECKDCGEKFTITAPLNPVAFFT